MGSVFCSKDKNFKKQVLGQGQDFTQFLLRFSYSQLVKQQSC